MTGRFHPAASALALTLAAALAPAALAAGDTDTSSQPTYNRDVAPILAERCTGCHRPGDIAPMSLRSYDEVRPWVKSIRKAVEAGVMPPWHADPAYGHWSNDRRLTDVERDTLLRWVKQGAPEGSGSAAGAVAVAAADASAAPDAGAIPWRLGQPDLAITFEPVALPAGGPDQFRDLIQSNPLPEDRWVSSVEIAPGDRRVVHHVIIYVMDEGQQAPNGWLGAWAAGMAPMVFPDGTGRLLKKGSRLVANMHYHPTDEATHDATTLGVHFLDHEPSKELVNLWVQNSNFKIPAGADDYEVRSTYTFRQDSVIHALLPHMHYRGKDFTYTVTYPDGRIETLLKVPAYDFNWQTLYEMEKPLDLPAGSKIDCVAHYDNSTKNKANPDPTKDVTFGNQSFDEMMIGFVDYTVKDGLRPMSAEERLAKISAELVRSHPGEVFSVRVWEQRDAAAAGSGGAAAGAEAAAAASSEAAGAAVGGESAGSHPEHGEHGEHAERRDPVTLETTLHFPAAGDGVWFIPFNGDVLEGKLVKITGTAEAWTASLNVSFGAPLQVEGKGGFGGAPMSGTLTMGKEKMGFEGAVR